MQDAQKILAHKTITYRSLVLARRNRRRLALWMQWLSSSLLICLIFVLQGCDFSSQVPLAPSPTPNPNPRTAYHLKISVQDGSGVNNVEVKSTWAVGNIGCLPIHPVSGATIQKQIETNEKVEKIGSEYVATIVEDRFLPDKCKWLIGGWGVWFLHDKDVLSFDASGASEFKVSKKLELTCIPPPDMPPLCGLRKDESFDRAHFKGVFNATLEISK